MPLVRLIYCSQAAPDQNDDSVQNGILVEATRFNTRNQITGILTIRNGQFLQAIEGSRSVVLDLFASISKDVRHHKVTLLHFSEVSARSFYKWSMGLIRESDIPRNISIYFGGSADFRFEEMRSDHSMSFLLYCAQRELVACADLASVPPKGVENVERPYLG